MIFSTHSLLPLILCVTVTPWPVEGEWEVKTISKVGSPYSLVVPTSGLYLVILRAHPYGENTDMVLTINGGYAGSQYDSRNGQGGVVAYARKGMIRGLSLAMPLQKEDNVSATFNWAYRSSSRLGLALVSTPTETNHFLTLRSSWADISKQAYLPFNTHMDGSGRWANMRTVNNLSFGGTGIHWVMVRLDCVDGGQQVRVYPGMFRARCGQTSGAYFLQANDTLGVLITSGPLLGAATIVSVIYLPQNQRSFLKRFDHVAFTGLTMARLTVSPEEKLHFYPYRTNYGGLYNRPTRTWRVPVTGTYVLGLRGAPQPSSDLLLIVYKKGKQWLFSSYSYKGVENGHDGVFRFNQGDELYVLAGFDRKIGPRTMMSLALLRVG